MPITPPSTDINIPGIAPRVKYCILRVDRSFDGTMGGSGEISYDCAGGNEAVKRTSRFSTILAWRTAIPQQGCDETSSIWPASLLQAKGTTIARDDGFAHFIGAFTLSRREDPNRPAVTFFKGTLELIARSGSHRMFGDAPGEACDERDHHEGWIVGRGVGPAADYTLRAVIAGKGVSSGAPLGTTFPIPAANRITGTLIKKP